MKKAHARSLFALLGSFLTALFLTLLPMPLWTSWFRPEWLLLVTMYWCLALPHRVSLGSAWCIGILLDVINGTAFGLHSIPMLVIAYLTVKLHHVVRVYPLYQQAIIVFVAVIMYQLILIIIHGLVGEWSSTQFYALFSAISSAIIWPWLFIILRDHRRRYFVI